jgi:outer membrane protein
VTQLISAARVLAAAAMLAAALAPAAAQTLNALPDQLLTLDAAVSMALEQNRRLTSGALSVENAEVSLETARWNRYPVFQVTALAAQSITEVAFSFPEGAFGTFDDGPVPAVDTKVRSPRRPLIVGQATVSQPLSQLPRLNLAMKAASASVDVERERQRAAQQAVLANVKRLYYALVTTDRALIAAAESLDTARQLDVVIQERLGQRVVLRADGLEAQLRVAQAEQTRMTLEHSRATQMEQLNELLGRDIHTRFVTVAPALDTRAADDVDAMAKRALDRRPDVREARLNVSRAELDRRLASAESVPDVSVQFSYSTVANVDVLPRNYTTLGLQVSWEPWDWGKRKRTVAQKVNVISQAKFALQDLEDAAVREVTSAYRRMQEARVTLGVVRLTQEIARERARVRVEQVRVAAVLPVEGLSAQTELARAGAQHQQALSDYWTARAQYELAIGEDVR